MAPSVRRIQAPTCIRNTAPPWRAPVFRCASTLGPEQLQGFFVYASPEQASLSPYGADIVLNTFRNQSVLPDCPVVYQTWYKAFPELATDLELAKRVNGVQLSSWSRHALCEFVQHFHQERNHQGKENVILFPEPADRIGAVSGEITSRERLGGLLRFYYREAA